MSTGIVKYLKSPVHGNGQFKPNEADPVEEKATEAESVAVCPSASNAEPSAGPSQRSKSEEDRIIAENMASVLKSLKKKRNHKCSRRRRNEEHRGRDRHRVTDEKNEDGLIEVIKVVQEDAIRRSPRKVSKNAKDFEKEKSPVQEPTVNKSKKVNAFQLMMSSRNKAIGSNSPGKDDAGLGEEDPEAQLKRGDKIKRKLKLEEWAERKGAGKRKLQESAEEEFIANQLNRRAKRMKRLIKNMETNGSDDDAVVETTATESAKRTKSKPPKKERPAASLKLKARQGWQRLSSEDSTQSLSNGMVGGVANTEKSPSRKPKDDNFVDKLSSPLKKKDSLLGYFSKVAGKDNSPGSTTEEKSPAGSRIRGCKSKPKEESPVKCVAIDQVTPGENLPASESTDSIANSGRPRRSCASKVKDYAVFAGTSPEKEVGVRRTSSRKAMVTPLKILNVGSPQTIKVIKSVRSLSIDSEPPSTPKSSKNVKLAPVFVKKPVEDPEKVRAKQEFLMSGIPEKMRLEIEKQRSFEESVLNESPVFPLISHIQQLDSPKKSINTSLKNSRIKVLLESPEKCDAGSKQREEEFEYSTLTSCDDEIVEDILARLIDVGNPDAIYSLELPDVANVKGIVREWKQIYRHFPVFKCYKQFRSMYEEHVEVGSPPGKHYHKEADAEDSIELVEPYFANFNGEILFTEKYKPTCLDHILVNCQPAIALKKFLSTWKEDRSSVQYGSEDDFEGSNSSVSSSSTNICNHVVLVGPTGCGKTCNVYAIANEMNFNVLELNASSRRKGKIILQELQEATQSHQVRRKDEQVDIFKKALARKNSKSKLRKLSTDSDGGVSSKKLSLILIEDADIVFDQDEGFVAAINQLISTSKRPIVLTTTNQNCPHLSRYIGNNVIRYVAPGIGHVAKLLSVLALVEKVHIDQNDLARLYALNRKDLRKTVNELQFFIQTGGDRNQTEQFDPETPLELEEENGTPSVLAVDDEASRQSNVSSTTSEVVAVSSRKHTSLFRLFNRDQNNPDQLIRMPLNFDNLWCNMERVLQTVPVTVSKAKKRKKKGTNHKQQVDLGELEELVFFYQNVSSAALVQRDTKRDEDRLVNYLEEEIAHDLVEDCWERWFEGDLDQEPVPDRRRSGVGAMCYDSLKQFDAEECQPISAYIGINPIRTRSTYCDYEPYLRTICRYERERSKLERRGSRFYHYLRNFMYTSANPGPMGVGGSMVTNFSVDHFDALSTRFEEDPIPAVESSDESR
ncbi:enhanced level of genomic instability 1 [Wyeomyia smithii]|uniref:enhanced level of genomic instability 1 n=1 Tax=Wyeomyia smithii TaxID=174621 RepID=UPI0024680A38|nr:enhanced level of genomic instability 1 [Wyeomyia smithii]XP_055533533.1 enhanced level of genomic instability 1 [Wyeomyia smithii]XP_055533534.1 enhanced level of genomic instability 1 [Wyeomyia smithii]XP_055533535.1 enhanced level of genomic instability 1 [Wyeomyia smithii]